MIKKKTVPVVMKVKRKFNSIFNLVQCTISSSVYLICTRIEIMVFAFNKSVSIPRRLFKVSWFSGPIFFFSI